jgi:hypothetical protein
MARRIEHNEGPRWSHQGFDSPGRHSIQHTNERTTTMPTTCTCRTCGAYATFMAYDSALGGHYCDRERCVATLRNDQRIAAEQAGAVTWELPAADRARIGAAVHDAIALWRRSSTVARTAVGVVELDALWRVACHAIGIRGDGDGLSGPQSIELGDLVNAAVDARIAYHGDLRRVA